MALTPVDWPAWKAAALGFLRAHPTVEVRDLTRSERLTVKGAKEAWAAFHHKAATDLRALGGQPCDACGAWTCCYCEACSHPPRAVCTECDREHLLCCSCRDRGLLFKEVERQSDRDVVEVSGYHDEEGNFVAISPPLRVAASDIPRQSDGSFDADEFMAVISRLGGHEPPAGARSA